MDHLWSPWRYRYVTSASPDDECFFCKKLSESDDRKNYILLRAEHNFVLLNVYPYTSGHVMVAPVRHAAGVLALTPEEGGAMFGATQRALRALTEVMHPNGFNSGINQGSAAGASAEHVCPAKIDKEKTKAIQDLALRAHRALGLQVYSRVDVLLPENGPPTLLEANTIPGMTEASLLPEAAAAAGIDYVDLCLRIIELSRARKERAGR